MKAEVDIKTDRELFESSEQSARKDLNVRVLPLTASQLYKHLKTTVYLRSSMFILVLNGTAEIEINFKKHDATQNKIILLSFGHFFKIKQLSGDFKCLVLYISKDYIDEMFSGEMIYKRVKYGVKMYQTPLLQLHAEQSILLKERIDFIREIVLNDQHRYYKEMILSALLIFFLDLSHIIEDQQEEGTSKQSRDELYFQQFLDLLVLNYKAQHYVEFYADKLHITTHYLTLIVKRLSGQTVSDLIFQLLFSEAKLLLQQPNLPIQEITALFHFSDQSSFGKFFKRKSGMSPKEFRQRMNS